MNWIATWCADRCELGKVCDNCYEMSCVPRRNIANSAKCSEHLIWILMNENGAVTHPNIANAIAEFTGATAEQRDEIVHKRHHGTWKPDPTRAPAVRNRVSIAESGAKAVVVIDRLGCVVERFPMLVQAAKRFGCSPGVISNRCNGVRFGKDEFVPYGLSFRFEEDWNRLTLEERIKNIKERNTEH